MSKIFIIFFLLGIHVFAISQPNLPVFDEKMENAPNADWFLTAVTQKAAIYQSKNGKDNY